MELTKKAKLKDFVFLHVILFLYSLGGVFSKLASSQPLFSFKFVLFYGIVLLNLFAYAILWQQILKRMPLTTAFSNKAVVVIWGLLWGTLFFNEKINIAMIVGAIIIIIGVLLVVSDNE